MTRASWTTESGTVQETEDRLLVRDVFRIVFFLPHDHFDLAAGVSHALDTYVRAVEDRPSALSEYLCCWWQPFKLGEQGWKRIRETLSPKERRFFEDYSPNEARSAEKDGASPYFVLYGERESGYCFDYRARLPFRETPSHYVSVLRITLPTEFLEEQTPGSLSELILDMASRLPFASGHAGLSLDIAAVDFDGLAALRPWMTRYPGFDLRNATLDDFMGTRVDGVHWMNFLGQPVLGALGGAAGLRTRLQSPSTEVRELDGERVLVTLGPEPEAGDLSQDSSLPAYRELARLLEPWLEPFNPDFLAHVRQTDEEELRRWWRRFLD